MIPYNDPALLEQKRKLVYVLLTLFVFISMCGTLLRITQHFFVCYINISVPRTTACPILLDNWYYVSLGGRIRDKFLINSVIHKKGKLWLQEHSYSYLVCFLVGLGDLRCSLITRRYFLWWQFSCSALLLQRWV